MQFKFGRYRGNLMNDEPTGNRQGVLEFELLRDDRIWFYAHLLDTGDLALRTFRRGVIRKTRFHTVPLFGKIVSIYNNHPVQQRLLKQRSARKREILKTNSLPSVRLDYREKAS